MTHSFTAKMHEEYGMLGWVLDKKPYFDPAAGMQLAHDVFEEFPNGQDQPHDELLALGASIFTRGEGGYFMYQPWHVNIAADFGEIFRHVEEESGYFLRSAPPTRRCEDWVESEFIRPLINTLKKQIAEADDEEYYTQILKEKSWYLDDAINWIRQGYKRAKKRYRYLDSCTVAHMFKELELKADKELSRAEEGDKLKVTVNSRRGWLKVQRIEGWELNDDY